MLGLSLVFLSLSQGLLGDSECMFQPDQITSLAQDRKGWKKLVVDDDDDDDLY